MSVMINGTFHAQGPVADTAADGEYRRAATTIRDRITQSGEFTPDAQRYHLYAAWNCPWAHRILLALTILDLGGLIPVAYARPRRSDQGWIYDTTGEFSDPELGISALHQVYARQRPAFTGRLTVPVLWDRQSAQIVSNESADIIRMLAEFGRGPELCPPSLRDDINRWNSLIYSGVNNGVYRAGFARSQSAYDDAVAQVFETLDRIEAQLAQTRWLTGEVFTEADLRLFPTLARFDVAYHYAFKCNIRRLIDYPNLWRYARRIYAMPGVADTVRFDIYKQGYFSPSELRNPLGIVPAGPRIDWSL
ncbi:MAG: glutathione S-transferase family protein [Paracoccaceae bacterium]